MRTARAKIEGAAYYPVMNRILERRYILKDEVAEKFRTLMRQVKAFSGVQSVGTPQHWRGMNSPWRVWR